MKTENEFIPYEHALALKELGFDKHCFWYYVLETNGDYKLYDKCEVKTYFTYIEAPLYQQAFRWFREKYDLDSFVKHLYKSKIKVGYYFGMDEYKGIDFQMYLDDYYKTYEEAELECLKKLIEIVKENRND